MEVASWFARLVCCSFWVPSSWVADAGPRWWLRLAVPAALVVAAAIVLLVIPRGAHSPTTSEPRIALATPPRPVPPPRPLPEPAAGPDVDFYWVSSSQRAAAPTPPVISSTTQVTIDRAPQVTLISPP